MLIESYEYALLGAKTMNLSKLHHKGIKFFDFNLIIPFRLYSQESDKRLDGLHLLAVMMPLKGDGAGTDTF